MWGKNESDSISVLEVNLGITESLILEILNAILEKILRLYYLENS